MMRLLLCAALLFVVLGCAKKPDLNPPDAPPIPPSTRSRENPGIPPKPGEAPAPGAPSAPAR